MFAFSLRMIAVLLPLICTTAWANNSINLNEHHPPWYASLGIGESVDYRAGEGSYEYLVPKTSIAQFLTFSPNYNVSPIYFQGELGYVWTQPFSRFNSNKLFFPFMSLGIQYRHTKPITSPTELNAINIATSDKSPATLFPIE